MNYGSWTENGVYLPVAALMAPKRTGLILRNVSDSVSYWTFASLGFHTLSPRHAPRESTGCRSTA